MSIFIPIRQPWGLILVALGYHMFRNLAEIEKTNILPHNYHERRLV
jgi:hypothetical protein